MIPVKPTFRVSSVCRLTVGFPLLMALTACASALPVEAEAVPEPSAARAQANRPVAEKTVNDDTGEGMRDAVTPSADHPLAFMFGEWVGPAAGVGPDRQPYKITQTERVGPMLDGDVVVVEGAGFGSDGSRPFNALAVISRTAQGEGWEIRSYAQGRAGTFPFEITDTGYVWSIPAGPGAKVRYTATISDDRWDQVGAFVSANGPPVKIFEMSLKRRGPSAWPGDGAVKP